MKRFEAEAARLELALDMHETGVAMMRAKLRREHPELSPPAIEALVTEWLHDRPGARDGDCQGRVVSWPRISS